MLEFNGTAVSRISGHLKCLQTVKKQSAHFHVGVLMTREMMRENGWCYAASIPGELWLISGAPPPPPAKKRQPVKEAASFTFNRWQCSLLASFWKTGRACKLQNVCQLTCVCVCATRCLLVPPSVSPNSPLPCFAKADPVSSTNKPFSGYLCSGPSREDGSGLETERLEFCWSSDPVGCICKASTAVNSGSTLAFFLCRISFFQLFQLYPLIPCLIEAGLGLGSGLL